jgi:acyl carrier protein
VLKTFYYTDAHIPNIILYKYIIQLSAIMPEAIPTDFYKEISNLVIETLNLEVSADEIKLDDPLYGDGLGLDSIDILEIALVVSKRYGLQLRADNQDNHEVFSSLRNFADYIQKNRTK